jgi:hypothetical protein
LENTNPQNHQEGQGQLQPSMAQSIDVIPPFQQSPGNFPSRPNDKTLGQHSLPRLQEPRLQLSEEEQERRRTMHLWRCQPKIHHGLQNHLHQDRLSLCRQYPAKLEKEDATALPGR